MPSNTIGENITFLRKRAGLTTKRLAEMLGVQPPTVHFWESGRNRPLPEYQKKMAEIFEVEVSDLEMSTERLTAFVRGESSNATDEQKSLEKRVEELEAAVFRLTQLVNKCIKGECKLC